MIVRSGIERLGLHLQGHWLTLVVITLHLERTVVSLRWQRNRRALERFADQKERRPPCVMDAETDCPRKKNGK
ncbi:hypothetical protein FG93_04577 [Bosea sp. LC85]|nr:hypothetical protein FG93_04577 [Bosea sp. LC85]